MQEPFTDAAQTAMIRYTTRGSAGRGYKRYRSVVQMLIRWHNELLSAKDRLRGKHDAAPQRRVPRKNSYQSEQTGGKRMALPISARSHAGRRMIVGSAAGDGRVVAPSSPDTTSLRDNRCSREHARVPGTALGSAPGLPTIHLGPVPRRGMLRVPSRTTGVHMRTRRRR